jgi:hypothetical protein
MSRLLLLGGGALLAVAASTVQPLAGPLGLGGERIVLAVLLGWVLFALAALLALAPRSRPGRAGPALAVVLAGAALCQLPGLAGPPSSSDDAYRYVWDGRVQLAGVSPYRYAPLDDALARLRDPVLFPGLSPQARSGFRTPDRLPAGAEALAGLTRPDPRTRINRPRVPTIYPPAGQAWFTGLALLTPRPAGTLGLQLAAAALALLVTAVLARLLLRRGRDPRAALLWGWCPLVAHEAGNGAHLDVLAAALIVLAVLAAGRRGPRAVGALLGLAAAVKLTPLLLLPAFTALRHGGRRRLWVPAVAVAVLAACYLPHLLAAPSRVLGYLPGYLTEEGFSGQRNRYAVIGLLLPGAPPAVLTAVTGVLALALAGLALRLTRPDEPDRTAVWFFGAALLLSTPGYPWYCLPLVALAVAAGRPQWLAVAVAAAVVGYRPNAAGWCYGLAALVVLAPALWAGLTRTGRDPRRSGSRGLGR